MKKHAIALLTKQVLQPGSNKIQLLPAGKFRSTDIRPEECESWVLTPELAQQLIGRAKLVKNDFLIDYEHQSLHTEKNGQPAPAAGWFKGANLVWQDDGLYVENVDWTPKAAAMIADKEYRYISTVFSYDKVSGAVTDIFSVTITNNPGLDGMNEITLAAMTKYAAGSTPPMENTMDKILALLRKLLGLADTATEAEILEALTQSVGQLPKDGEGDDAATASLSRLITLHQSQSTSLADKDQEIAALKTAASAAATKAGQPDLSKYVPIEAVTQLQKDIAALTAKVNGGEVSDLIEAAIKDGKILPPMKAWAEGLGKQDVAALKSFIDNAAPIAALTKLQSGGTAPTGEHGLTAVELEAATISGLTAAEYAEAKKGL
ncbi:MULTISPECIES: phage protease [Providencia]|uniref:phage protease n=1 Tax=Providencia TaxID=586 RepID=UPI00140CE65B|nr:phage protease [Providencia sp. M-27]